MKSKPGTRSLSPTASGATKRFPLASFSATEQPDGLSESRRDGNTLLRNRDVLVPFTPGTQRQFGSYGQRSRKVNDWLHKPIGNYQEVMRTLVDELRG